MALKPISFFCMVCFILSSVLVPVSTVRAFNEHIEQGNLPLLNVFIDQVKNGRADELRGIYIPEILAFRIIQQPERRKEFVSTWDNVVTQFDSAADLGSTGLLAHNFLAGKSFPLVRKNHKIYLVHGDGRTSTYLVTEILQFKALDPGNVSGNFANLENGTILTASQLFRNVYSRLNHVILQTCITAENDNTWGRLFIVAAPYSE